MNMIVSLFRSVIRPAEYAKLRDHGIGKVFLGILALTLTLGIVAYIGFTVSLAGGIREIRGMYDTKVPDFSYTAEAGVSVDAPMPIIHEDNRMLIIIDATDPTDSNITETYLPRLKGYDKGIIIGNRTIVNKKNAINTETYDLNQLNTFAPFDKADVAKLFRYWWVIALICFPFYIGWFFVAKLLSSLLLSVVGLIINAVGNYRLQYAALWNASVYALVLPATAKVIIGFFGIDVPVFFLIYHAVAVVFLIIGLRKLGNSAGA